MLDDIQRIFRRSINAFLDELNTREPEDEVAELLSGMRKELVAARAAIPEYEALLARARQELARERDALAQTERRGAMAEKIGDGETVRIAGDFADRHRSKVGVLEQKVAAAEAELDLRRREADDMKRQYQYADGNRFALLAQLRRARASQNMRSAHAAESGPMADWARMEEKVENNTSYVDALNDLDSGSAPPPSPPPDVEDRLRELKRRMGRSTE